MLSPKSTQKPTPISDATTLFKRVHIQHRYGIRDGHSVPNFIMVVYDAGALIKRRCPLYYSYNEEPPNKYR